MGEKELEEIFNSCKGQVGTSPSFDDKLILKYCTKCLTNSLIEYIFALQS